MKIWLNRQDNSFTMRQYLVGQGTLEQYCTIWRGPPHRASGPLMRRNPSTLLLSLRHSCGHRTLVRARELFCSSGLQRQIPWVTFPLRQLIQVEPCQRHHYLHRIILLELWTSHIRCLQEEPRSDRISADDHTIVTPSRTVSDHFSAYDASIPASSRKPSARSPSVGTRVSVGDASVAPSILAEIMN